MGDTALIRYMAKRQLVLHVGLPKTGSTSIQTYMRQFHTADKQAGLWYPPPFGGFNNHNGLRHAFDAPDRVEALFQSYFAPLDDMDEGMTAVLSSEPLAQVDADWLVWCIPERFRNGVDWSLSVVAYFRPHISSMIANYQQAVKSGRTTDDFWWEMDKPVATEQMFYERIAEKFAANDAVRFIPRIFQRARLEGGDVVQDFISILRDHGCNPPPPEEALNKNTSLSPGDVAGCLYLTRMLDRDMPDKPRRRLLARFRKNVLEGLAGRIDSFDVSADHVTALQDRYLADARAIDARVPGTPGLEDALMAHPKAAETMDVKLSAHFSPEDIRVIERRARAMATSAGALAAGSDDTAAARDPD